jgi:vacuolar-type H+-ATPase subunit E/Vma4
MIEFAAITSAIIKHAPQASQSMSKQAQKNEAIIKILQKFELHPTQIPDDIDTVYVYALIRYGVYKAEAYLNVFRERAIKDYFWTAYSSNTPFKFVEDTKKFLHSELKMQIIDEIKFFGELEEFGEAFIAVAKQTKSSKFKPYPDWDLDVYPKEFKALMLEKTRLFCGRDFVFQAIEEFFKTQPKGYFTVIGDAGMGKSAIAAKYVLATRYPCYFNIFAVGRNKPENFLDSIRKQLIKICSLQNANNADLSTLLQKASEKLKGQKLVIVVDALDEVEQEGNSNLLDLPQNIPGQVYFLLTRRPYNQETKRLILSPDTPEKELDLRKDEYKNFSAEDVKDYIHRFITDDKHYKDKLKKWITDRNIYEHNFIEEVAAKSENNFMYLRYVLPWIAEGEYSDLTLQGLPQGLRNYYQVHWQRMEMENESNEMKVKILYMLVERGEPISLNMIAEILDRDEYDVKSVLDDWVEYITEKVSKNEKTTYYKIYHLSFLEFLKEQDKLAKGRRLFKEVNQRIADYLEQRIA